MSELTKERLEEMKRSVLGLKSISEAEQLRMIDELLSLREAGDDEVEKYPSGIVFVRDDGHLDLHYFYTEENQWRSNAANSGSVGSLDYRYVDVETWRQAYRPDYKAVRMSVIPTEELKAIITRGQTRTDAVNKAAEWAKECEGMQEQLREAREVAAMVKLAGHTYGVGDPTDVDPEWPIDPEAVRVLETGEYLLPDECAVKMNRAACELREAREEIERLKGENQAAKNMAAFMHDRKNEAQDELAWQQFISVTPLSTVQALRIYFDDADNFERLESQANHNDSDPAASVSVAARQLLSAIGEQQ